jgi:membrane-associated phospholipid phosphatase
MLGAAAAFAALSALVAAGALTRLDQWAMDHAMTDIRVAGNKVTLADALVPLLHTDFGSPLDVVTGVATAPASLLLSFVLVAGCCAVLQRRGSARAAYAWACAWLAGNIVEVLCKWTLTRPALYSHGLHVVAFDSSFPSGHTIRSIVVAAALAAAFPAARLWVAAWACVCLVLLEADAWHTPSDIAGGVLLSALLLAAARGFGRD